MTYQLENVSTQQLALLPKVKINKQSQIKKKFGQPLSLTRAYQLIKEESNNFKKKNDTALEADGLLYGLLLDRGVFKKPKEAAQEKPTDSPKDKLVQINKKLRLFNIALKRSKGEAKSKIEKKIRLFNISKKSLEKKVA